MDTFMLRLPWWPVLRLFSRNPLVRTVDRVEGVLVLGAVVVSLLAAPFAAAAVGTRVHDARSHVYTEQPQARHAVAATVTGVHGTGAGSAPSCATSREPDELGRPVGDGPTRRTPSRLIAPALAPTYTLGSQPAARSRGISTDSAPAS